MQNNGESFKTVEQLLNAMSPSFVDALTNTTYKVLKDQHFSDRMINEIVRAALRVNYGQDIDVHFFVGMYLIYSIVSFLLLHDQGIRKKRSDFIVIHKTFLVLLLYCHYATVSFFSVNHFYRIHS